MLIRKALDFINCRLRMFIQYPLKQTINRIPYVIGTFKSPTVYILKTFFHSMKDRFQLNFTPIR